MLIANPYLRSYLFTALSETPSLFRKALSEMTDFEADRKFDPERFTLREMIAHLADWELVYQERFTRVVDEDDPLLPNIDEGQRAMDNEYTKTDWLEQVALFDSRRAETVNYLKSLAPEAWSRCGLRPEIGHLSLLDLVQILPLHDIYHLKQIREYLG